MDDCNRKSEELIEEIEGVISYVEKGGRDRTDGEQVDDSVQNFESELREVFEHTAVGIYRTTPDGRILMANPALVRMLGFSSFEQLAQRNLGESGFEPDYHRKLFRERIEKEGKIVGLESVWMTRQGKCLVIIENARVVRDQDQNVLYYEGTAENITERKQAEDELRSSQERLKILFESAPDGIFLYDLEGGVVDGNKASEELVGYARDELIGENFGETGLLSAEQMPKAIENLRKNARGEPTGPDEFTLRRKDGGFVTIEIRTFPVTIDGQALSLGIARDITQRKRAERATEERLRFERMLSTISGRFVNLAVDEIDKAIEDGLGLVGEFFGVDRVTIGELAGEKNEARAVHIWHSKRCDGRVKDLALKATYPHVAAYVERKGAFVYNKPDDLPKGWKEERQFVLASGVKSGVIVPLRVGGAFLGAISVNSLENERAWPDGTVERLALVGEILANALNRKRAEEALWESEARLKSIFRVAPVGIGLVSDRVLLNVNDRVCEMTGYSRDELVGENARILYPTDEDYEYVGREKYGQIRERGTGIVETRWRHKDGRVIDVLLSSTPLDPKNLSAGVTFTALDITERKRAERALRQERDRAQTYLDVAGVMFVVIGIDRKVKLINKRGCDILGYDEGEIIGKDWFDNFLPEDFREHVGAVFDALIAGDIEPVEYYENPIIGKDGSERLIAWHNTVLRDESDKIIGTLASGEDITERKRAEEVLRAEKNKLTAIFEAMVDGAYIVNEQYDIEYVNPVLEKEFGRWQGRKCYEYFHDRKEICPWCKNSDVLAGKTVRWEWCLLKNGKTYDLIDTPLQNPDGSVSKLEIFRDITERKEAEEKAREHQSELAHVWRVNTMGEMASGLAHELNQPLCAILNYANACLRMIKRQADESGELIVPIEQIATQAERAGEIIRRIRGLVAKRRPHTSAVDINDIVREVVGMEKSEANLKGITIQTELGEDTPQVLADSVEIEEVILNLVRNAFDAMSDRLVERREVTITTCTTECGEVEICVRDTGKGLAGLGEQIFDSFFTTKVDGLGIGLSISRTIVELHGGKLWAESNPDCGASFRFTLPVKGTDAMYCEDKEESISNGENV